MTRTSSLNFNSGPNPDPADQWDTKCKLISLAEVCTLSSVLIVSLVFVLDQPSPLCSGFVGHMHCLGF